MKINIHFKLILMFLLILVCMTLYMTLDVNFSKTKFIVFSLKLRYPKLIAMTLAAFAIGASTIVFQTIVNNQIITPGLLGMSSLYTVLHTIIIFIFGTGSILAINKNASFFFDLVIMVATSLVVYGFLFKKTKYNVLFILLIGTVLSSLFSSVQSALIRIMDPNDYDVLLTSLVASFNHMNSEILTVAFVLISLVTIFLWKDLKVLDVMALGKNQAINLGIDYDKTVRRLLVGVTLYVAIATALVGPISFLGLIVANLSRTLLKTYKHKNLILGSSFIGIITLIGGEVLVEHVFEYSVPVSVFITLFGGIYFLILLLWRKKA